MAELMEIYFEEHYQCRVTLKLSRIEYVSIISVNQLISHDGTETSKSNTLNSIGVSHN